MHKAAVTNHSVLIFSPRFKAIPPTAAAPRAAISIQIEFFSSLFISHLLFIVDVLPVDRGNYAGRHAQAIPLTQDWVFKYSHQFSE
jgi:hypothetical protein